MNGPWRRAVDSLTAVVLFGLAIPCLAFGTEKLRGLLSVWNAESSKELREGDPEAYFWLLVAGIPLLAGFASVGLTIWFLLRAVGNRPMERS